MSRVILHSDLNAFFASVECLYNPEIRNKPVAVGGDAEKRHGIILTKNNIAKKYKIQTGETLSQAFEKCPDLIIVKPTYYRYQAFSEMARKIYYDYSNFVEGFGIDENWVLLSNSGMDISEGERIAHEIRERVKLELGLSVSIGVSYNKIFAKLGSDIKKPDAVTVVSEENYQDVAWPLPVSDLLYVGPQTTKKLHSYGVRTIGALAQTNVEFLKGHFGKIGVMLWRFANGYDNSPVMDIEYEETIKSIGNSTTTVKDLVTDEDIRITLYSLCENIATRLREKRYVPSTIQIWIRDKKLVSFERQAKLPFPSSDSNEIFKLAYRLVKKNIPAEPIRSLGVRACQLSQEGNKQLSLFSDVAQAEKHEQAEIAIDEIRERFGRNSVRRGIMLADRKLSDIDFGQPHPVAFLKSN